MTAVWFVLLGTRSYEYVLNARNTVRAILNTVLKTLSLAAAYNHAGLKLKAV